MNGDGLADLVAFNPSNSSVIVALATASSTSNPSYDSCSAYSSLGVSFGTPVVWSQGAVCGAGHVCDVADVTGDGKADIVDFQNGHGTGGTSNVEIAVSSGAGLLAAQSWLSGFCDPGQTCAVADVNGDGTADAIAYDPSKNVWVALSSGTGFGGVNVWGSFLCTGSYSCSFADVTGDGRADLLQLTHSATVNMAPSAWPAPMFDAATFWDGEICASPQTCLIGDVNGDHLADAVAIDPSGVPIWAVTAVPATPVTYGQGLAWQNPTSGVISIWNLDGTTVANSMNLQWTCGTDCGWRVVDTGTKAAAPGPGNSILWYNSASGQLAEWVFDATGNVNTTPAYTWTCSTATDCAPSWQPIGRVNQVVATTGAVGRGLLWYNSSLGQLSIWELANGTTNVTTQTPLPQTCVGCAGNWEPVLTSDFDNDGNTDILWYNVQTGALGLWLLNGSGSVSQFVNLSMSCGGSCEQTWKIAGAADVNGDGNVDVLWQNLTNGQMMSWLLNGSSSTVSTVIGQVTIAGATAPAQSLPLGFINYPAPL